MYHTTHDEHGLDPGTVYSRGALVAPVADLWTTKGTEHDIQLRGLPGIQIDIKRPTLNWVWPRTWTSRRNIASGLLPDGLAGVRAGLSEPGD